MGQCQIMSGEQTERVAVEQRTHNGFGPQTAIVGVGAAEQLVEQEKQGHGALGQVEQLADPRHLGVEAGAARLERILNSQSSAESKR